MIDESTELGRGGRDLRGDRGAWLTMVTPGGVARSSPVGSGGTESDSVFVFSLLEHARTWNIEANPQVSLNFEGDGEGGDIVIRPPARRSRPAPRRRGRAVREEEWRGFERLRATRQQFVQRYRRPSGSGRRRSAGTGDPGKALSRRTPRRPAARLS